MVTQTERCPSQMVIPEDRLPIDAASEYMSYHECTGSVSSHT